MSFFNFISLLLIAAGIAVSQSGGIDSIAESHIAANVPPAADFDRLLKRDLKAHFNGLTVQYELLRDRPTQSGTAYPKYYLWVRSIEGGKVVLEGAARLAAIERTRFEVTSFLAAEKIRSSPSEIDRIFPAALKKAIVDKAGRAKQ